MGSGRLIWLLPVLAAAAAYACLIPESLPLNGDLALAAQCLHRAGHGGFIPFVWGCLLKLSAWLLPGSGAFRLGVVSALSGVVAVASFTYAISRLLPFGASFANRNARGGDLDFGLIPPLTAVVGGIAFAVSLLVFGSAVQVGPTATQIALAMIPFALAARCMEVERNLTRLYLIVLIGLVAGLAALEGSPGVMAFPLAFGVIWLDVVRDESRIVKVCGCFALGVFAAACLVVGDELNIPRLQLTVHRGFMAVLAVAVVPALAVYRMMKTRHLGGVWSRLFVFGVWAVVCAGLARSFYRSNAERADETASAFVKSAVTALDGRRWIVSDGAYDELIVFFKPPEAHLLTLRRDLDPSHGQEIASWVREELGDEAELLLAAEFGPADFLATWLKREGAVTNCMFIARSEPDLSNRSGPPPPDGTFWTVPGVDGTVSVADAERRWRKSWGRLNPPSNIKLGAVPQNRDEALTLARLLRRMMVFGKPKLRARVNLAMSLSILGKHGEAEKILRTVSDERPDDWRILDAMSVVLAAGGKAEEAKLFGKRAESQAERVAEKMLYRETVQSRGVGREGVR